MHFHCNAALNAKQRAYVGASARSRRDLAAHLHVSPTTIHRWSGRKETGDRSSRPHTIRYALRPEEEQMALALRAKGLSLDDLHEALLPVLPQLSRASLHRLLVREGVSRLHPQPKRTHSQFKDYAPGFLHLDCFKLPKLQATQAAPAQETPAQEEADEQTDEVWRYCFVAIDRATRLLFLWLYPDKTKHSATDFLRRVVAFFPFVIEKILTDNGGEFSLNCVRAQNKSRLRDDTVHPFEHLCEHLGIEHRQTRPYTPQTNGLVERANGLTKQNTLQKHRYETHQQMRRDLHLWWRFYNWHRPHRKLHRKTPWQTTLDWFDKQPHRFTRNPHLDPIPLLTW